jgi:putative mycofactocin binding protein MftB
MPGADEFPLDQAWSLSSAVALRPERFGALSYHFGTRRLSFLKSRRLLDVVQELSRHPSARAACDAVGVTADERPAVGAALARLASTDFIVRREMP